MRRARWERRKHEVKRGLGDLHNRNISESQPGRVRGRLRTGRSRWTMSKLGCGEKDVVLGKDVVVESEAKVRPTLRIASSSHLKCLYACKTTSNYIHLPRILFPLPRLHRHTHELGRPRFIAAWHRSDIFLFMLAVADSNRFDRCEGRSIFKRVYSSKGG